MSPRALVSLALLVALAGAALAQQPAAPAQPDFDAVQVRSFRVQGNVHMLVGAGGNVTVQSGGDGVLVVDTQFAPMADKLLAEIRRLAGTRPIRYVINTHVHGDHTGGNARFRAAGDAIVAGNVAFEIRPDGSTGGSWGAALIAHENVQARLAKPPAGAAAAPPAAWPTEVFFTPKYELHFNDEPIELIHVPAAHTDGDVLVFFRKSDVIAAGDVFTTTGYPFVDLQRGGSINGLIAGLNRIIDLTVPKDKQEKGTMVVSGHGRIADEADVVEYRDMVTIVRDRVRALIARGMTLDQVQAARPTADYDGRYGATTGFLTTAAFVESVYRSLGQAAPGRTE